MPAANFLIKINVAHGPWCDRFGCPGAGLNAQGVAAYFREASMIRLVTRGRFTQDYVKGMMAAPEDREPVVRKLIEAVGGKVISFYGHDRRRRLFAHFGNQRV